MSSPRIRRIADRIQVIVAEMIEHRIKDPRLAEENGHLVTITEVRLTGDGQQATVFYTVLASGQASSDPQEALAGTAAALESAKGLIRSEVAKQLGMRITPSLTFVPDALPESAAAIEDVLRRAREQDEQVAAARAAASYAGDEDPYRKPHEDDDLDDEYED